MLIQDLPELGALAMSPVAQWSGGAAAVAARSFQAWLRLNDSSATRAAKWSSGNRRWFER